MNQLPEKAQLSLSNYEKDPLDAANLFVTQKIIDNQNDKDLSIAFHEVDFLLKERSYTSSWDNFLGALIDCASIFTLEDQDQAKKFLLVFFQRLKEEIHIYNLPKRILEISNRSLKTIILTTLKVELPEEKISSTLFTIFLPYNFLRLFSPKNKKWLHRDAIGFLDWVKDNPRDKVLIKSLKEIDNCWSKNLNLSEEEQWIEFMNCLFEHDKKPNTNKISSVAAYMDETFKLLSHAVRSKQLPKKIHRLSVDTWHTFLNRGWAVEIEPRLLNQTVIDSRLVHFFINEPSEYEKFDQGWLHRKIYNALIDSDFPDDQIELYGATNNFSFLKPDDYLTVKLSPLDISQINHMQIIYEQWLKAKDLIRSKKGRPWEEAAEIMLLKTPGETKEKEWSDDDVIKYCTLVKGGKSPEEAIDLIARAKEKSYSAACMGIYRRFSFLSEHITNGVKKPRPRK